MAKNLIPSAAKRQCLIYLTLGFSITEVFEEIQKEFPGIKISRQTVWQYAKRLKTETVDDIMRSGKHAKSKTVGEIHRKRELNVTEQQRFRVINKPPERGRLLKENGSGTRIEYKIP
ncbi:hypothetical protein KMW28_27300 [Flammeovirga yaeyamensis]|uniref:Transposase n=1 Tax=Flammeovirga yaeyamensis TaxID=367791 RepID=A0AAX1NEG5_9BACT|nr:hypothetical protein [Flammeovirga yaeyamensis]MBB3700011.1 voltage-gated potassium channel Kch [Flammeovirga yaeyamensis]NMF37551.1 hypothetical protein [Flammeovirga yaeyamensis]QWG04608.1 hypothetical protein KMW28_27300 [Flammeovirga yaeyamensis]